MTEVSGILNMGPIPTARPTDLHQISLQHRITEQTDIYCITINSKQHSHSSEVYSSSASHEIPMHVIRKDPPPRALYWSRSIHSNSPPSYFLYDPYSYCTIYSYVFKAVLILHTLPFNPVFNYLISHACYTPLRSHLPWLNPTITARKTHHEAPPYIILSTLLSPDPQHPVKTTSGYY